MISSTETDVINVAYATDNRGLELCCSSIYSIIRRKKPSTKIKFYILGNGLKNIDFFHSLKAVKNINTKVIQIDPSKVIGDVTIPPRLGSSSHLRIIIPELEELKHLDKILYLDIDIFGRRDIANIYHTELDGFSIGMVKDASGVLSDGIDKWPSDRYFHKDYFYNTGLMLMDLNKLRSNKAHLKWLQAVLDNKNPDLNDQNLINTFCHYDCKSLPPTYQLSYHNLIRYPHTFVHSIAKWNKYYGTHYSCIKELVDSSYLWHFHENKEVMMRDFPKIKHIITSFIDEYKVYLKTKLIQPWKPEDDKHLYM